jgi:hypothetical protein
MFGIKHKYELVGVIGTQLLEILAIAPAMEPKDLYVEQVLDQMFRDYNWAKSFDQCLVILYDEVMPSELVIILHQWLRRKCANIENIILVQTHHLGSSSWWQQYCDTMRVKSFKIHECFFTHSPDYWPQWFANIPELPSSSWFADHKNIQQLFSFYGGSYSSLERQYLILRLLTIGNHGAIDYLGKFDSQQAIIDWTEFATYYCNQDEINSISSVYYDHVDSNKMLKNKNCISPTPSIKNERLTYSGFQWSMDSRSFASIIRETLNSDVYSCLTEKTLRGFLHHTAVVPLGFQAVDHLEKWGFWFPHDIIDYKFQNEPVFSKRISMMLSSMNKVIDNYSYQDLQKIYEHNIDNFHRNASRVHAILGQD